MGDMREEVDEKKNYFDSLTKKEKTPSGTCLQSLDYPQVHQLRVSYVELSFVNSITNEASTINSYVAYINQASIFPFILLILILDAKLLRQNMITYAFLRTVNRYKTLMTTRCCFYPRKLALTDYIPNS